MSPESAVILTLAVIWIAAPFLLTPVLARPYVADGLRDDENAGWEPRVHPGYVFARFWVRLPRPAVDLIAVQILGHLKFHTRQRTNAIYQFVLPNGSFVTLEDRQVPDQRTGQTERSLSLMRHRTTSTRSGTRLVAYSFTGAGTGDFSHGWFNEPMTERQESWVLGRLATEIGYAYAFRDRDRVAGSIVIRPAEEPRELAPGEDTRR